MNKPGKQEWSSQRTWKRNSEERGEHCLVLEGDGVVQEKMDTWTLQKCDEEEGSDGWTWNWKLLGKGKEGKVEFVMREEGMKETLLLLLLLLIRILNSLGFQISCNCRARKEYFLFTFPTPPCSFSRILIFQFSLFFLFLLFAKDFFLVLSLLVAFACFVVRPVASFFFFFPLKTLLSFVWIPNPSLQNDYVVF